MYKIKSVEDARLVFDKRLGVLRKFFISDVIKIDSIKEMDIKEIVDNVLKENEEILKLKDIDLRFDKIREGISIKSAVYRQFHNDIPVFQSQLIVGIRKKDNCILSFINDVDYDISETLNKENVKIQSKEVTQEVNNQLQKLFEKIEIKEPKLILFRYFPKRMLEIPEDASSIRKEMFSRKSGEDGKIYLTWMVPIKTIEPNGSWRVFVDAQEGIPIFIEDQRRYNDPKAYVYWPDPITSSQNDELSSTTPEEVLNNEREEVTLENLDPPISGVYRLEGRWVRIVDIEAPSHTPPTSAGDFKYGATDNNFYCVMAYYYLDRFISYLHDLGIPEYNQRVTEPINVDAQGCTLDQSHFDPDDEHISLGIGYVPDATDPEVILHEYVHALRYYLIGDIFGSWFEQGICDFIAGCWIDRYNRHLFDRAKVFPWDQNKNVWRFYPEWRHDITERFDDPNFSSYSSVLRRSIVGTALWDLYLNMGGSSQDEGKRITAQDWVIETVIEMFFVITSYYPIDNPIAGLITADDGLTGGVLKKAIWDAFRRRGHYHTISPDGDVDLHIRVNNSDGGLHAGPEIHWESPDIWVRNTPVDPEEGHQVPCKFIENYIYVRVHNRGSITADNATVEVFRRQTEQFSSWREDFESLGILNIVEQVPPGGNIIVGPFNWMPIMTNEIIIAVVDSPQDQSVAYTVHMPVAHEKLVRFDNNVGQRNISVPNCYATTFKGNSICACILLILIYTPIIALLAIPALFSSEIRCYIKTLIYQMNNCTKGNNDPCIDL